MCICFTAWIRLLEEEDPVLALTILCLHSLAGVHTDVQESYFLSETIKYLWLTWTEGSAGLLDHFVFSTEGHLLPPHPTTSPVSTPVQIKH